MISIPNVFAEQIWAPSWLPSCATEAPLVHSYTEASILYTLFAFKFVSYKMLTAF